MNKIVVGFIEFGTPKMSSEALASAVYNAGVKASYVLVFNPPGRAEGFKILKPARKVRLWVKQNEENVGFTKAANYILDFDPTKDVVLINTDILCEPNWLKELQRAAYSRKDIKIGLAAPRIDNKILYPKHQGRQTCGVTSSDCDGQPTPYEGIFRGWFGFACAYFRRDMLEDQGYLDTRPKRFKNYGSDKAYGKKVSGAGYWIAHTHASVVHHIGEGTHRRKGVEFSEEVRAKCLPTPL